MGITIKNEKRIARLDAHIESMLPYRLCAEIRRVCESENIGRIEEIRLRRDRVSSLTANGRNIILSSVLGREEMESVLASVCDHSLYAHRTTIANGYVTLSDGVRVGICGRASVDGTRVIGVYDVSSINIRIPHTLRRVGEPICRLLRSGEDVGGVLIYSPPGEGKTTLLRAVAFRMASADPPMRVALIDTRGELSFSLSDTRACLDVLSGYPKKLGIEIATRCMNAELIVCDEIGDKGEAEEIAQAQNCGVPFVASAHADTLSSLLRRDPIACLHKARVFAYYVGIKRGADGDFVYDVSKWEVADELIHTCGSSDRGGLRDRRSAQT